MAEKYQLPNSNELGDAYNALTATVGKKKNQLIDMLAPYFSDYGQLIEKGSPLNNQYQQLKSNISQHIPSNADFRSPQAMSEWSQAAALNAPMGLTLKGVKATKFSKSHDVAQKNAALPIEQGGLGLPLNNTAMDRARAMGFITSRKKELYHGTTNDFYEIDPTRSDLGFHVGALEHADTRLKNRAWGDKIGSYSLGTNIMPLMENKYSNLLRVKDEGSFHADSIAKQLEKKKILAKGKAKFIDDYVNTPTDGDSFKSPTWIERRASQDDLIRRVLDDAGHGGVVYKNEGEGIGDIDSKAFINPSMLRSRFAAFDPMKKDSANILASLLLGTTVASQYRDKKK